MTDDNTSKDAHIRQGGYEAGLEAAAKVAEDYGSSEWCISIAERIRALKDQPHDRYST